MDVREEGRRYDLSTNGSSRSPQSKLAAQQASSKPATYGGIVGLQGEQG